MSSTARDTIARGSVINLVTRVLTVGLGAAVTLVVARLGPWEQGAFALYTAIESVLLMMGSGFGVVLARRISHHGEHPAALAGSVVLVSLAIGLASTVALQGLSVLTEAYAFLMPLAWTAPFIFLVPNLTGLWLGLGRMSGLAAVTVGSPLLTLMGIGAYALMQGTVTLAAVLWAWAGARAVVGLGAAAAALRSGWLGKPRARAFRGQWSFVGLIGVTNLVALLNYKAPLFLIESQLGRATTGVYSIAVLLAELLWLVSSSITQAAYSRIGTQDAATAAQLTVRAIQASLLALLVLAPALWVGAAFVVPALLGDVYAPSLTALAILLPGVVAYGAASALSAYFTNHAGTPATPAAMAGLSLLGNVVLASVLIPLWGLHGAALATTISYVIAVAVSMGLFCRRSGTPLHRLLLPDFRWMAQAFRALDLGGRGSAKT